MTVYDAAMRYAAEETVGGDWRRRLRNGSSDWAAKGYICSVSVPSLRRVSAHPSFEPDWYGDSAVAIPRCNRRPSSSTDRGFDLSGLSDGVAARMTVPCRITRQDGSVTELELICRLDTDVEVAYYQNGGMLHYCLREALEAA